jgi:hypothetical protein
MISLDDARNMRQILEVSKWTRMRATHPRREHLKRLPRILPVISVAVMALHHQDAEAARPHPRDPLNSPIA